MTHFIRKTVVVGLGGTGLRTVLHLKRKLIEIYGKVPLCYKFLVLDTADQDPLTYRNEEYKLEAGEFYRLSVEDPATFIEINNEVRQWFPSNVPKKELIDGAGQIRALGRLGLYFHADDIYNRIFGILNDVNNYKIGRIDEQFELNTDDRLVIITGSMAGGTGGGTFLELGHVIRSMLQPSEKIIGIFLLPDGFVGLPGCDRVLANTYASLKELDYVMSMSATAKRSFKFGGQDIPVKYSPYSRTFLINNSAQESRFSFDNLDSLMELMSTGILVASGAVGKKDKDIWDNLTSQLRSGAKWLGREANYCSFGVGELAYDRDGIIKNAKARASLGIIDQCLLCGPTPDSQSEIDKIIERLHLREEDPHNEVVDRVLGDSDIFIPSKPDPTAENMNSLFKRKDSLVEDQEFQMRALANQRAEAIIEETRSTMDNLIRGILTDCNNLVYVHGVLDGLLTRITEYKAMMVKERIEHEKQLDLVNSLYNEYYEDSKQAARRFLGGRHAREEVIDSFLSNYSKHLHIKMEIERRRVSADIFQAVSQDLEPWVGNLEKCNLNLNSLRTDLNETVSRGVSSSRSIKPFIKYVPYPSNELTQIQIKPEDFKAWLMSSKGLGLDEIVNKSKFDLKSLFFEFAETLPVIQTISGSSVEDVLELYEEKKWDYITNLNTMAAPMWQYKAVYAAGNLVKICIFGVSDPDGSFLQDKSRLRSLLNLKFEPTNVANGDSLRILCFKIEAVGPAYILDRLSKYKEEYDRMEEMCTFHLGVDFFDLPEITPIKINEESRQYWSVAFAPVFDIIVRKGASQYFIRSKSKGMAVDDFLLPLANGRVPALNAFLDNGQYVNEAIKEINLAIDKLGRVEVARRLREYQVQLVESAKNKKTIKADIRELLNREIEDIKNFISELESVV